MKKKGKTHIPERGCAWRGEAGNRTIASLTLIQAEWLRLAASQPEGCYVPITSGEDPDILVNSGLAEYREERRSGGTRSVHDFRPCEWTDLYLVITDAGRAMLSRYTERMKSL